MRERQSRSRRGGVSIVEVLMVAWPTTETPQELDIRTETSTSSARERRVSRHAEGVEDEESEGEVVRDVGTLLPIKSLAKQRQTLSMTFLLYLQHQKRKDPSRNHHRTMDNPHSSGLPALGPRICNQQREARVGLIRSRKQRHRK